MGKLYAHLKAAPESQYLKTEVTPLRRLDDIRDSVLENSRVPFLKIDTQGYELPVLQGAQEVLKRIRGVQVELSLVPLYKGQASFGQLTGVLGDSGFDLWGFIPGFVDQSTGRMLQFDGIFFRK
jgi:Methyltransferase FkbM domain